MKKRPGLFCVVLGPDGAGKGTLIRNFISKYSFKFNKIYTYHWRPGILPPLRRIFRRKPFENNRINGPHVKNLNEINKIQSFIRWIYYTLDFFLGYIFKIYPQKIKGGLIFIERYYFDFLVDQLRYGFYLPESFYNFILRFIPTPDITFYLDNEPQEFYKRKKELPIEELKRQISKWREYISLLPNPYIIITNKSVDEVTEEVAKIIIKKQNELIRRETKVEPKEVKYLILSNFNKDFLAFPSKKNCRWIIPANPKLAAIAWELYLPYSKLGKFYKSTMKFLSRKNALKFLKKYKVKYNYLNRKTSQKLKNLLSLVFRQNDLTIAISTGTPGPFRKITGMILNSNGDVLGYIKIAETPLAIERLKNEINMLRILGTILSQTQEQRKVLVPRLIYTGKFENVMILIQSPSPFFITMDSVEFNRSYRNLILEFLNWSAIRKKFNETKFFSILKTKIRDYHLSYRDLLKEAFDIIETKLKDKEILLGISHGDFVPWNMFWSKDKLKVFIYDWESSLIEAPAALDAIHFLFQVNFLLKSYKGKELLESILYSEELKNLMNELKEEEISLKEMVLIYLLHMAVYEDERQILSKSAVERRKLIKFLLNDI